MNKGQTQGKKTRVCVRRKRGAVGGLEKPSFHVAALAFGDGKEMGSEEIVEVQRTSGAVSRFPCMRRT